MSTRRGHTRFGVAAITSRMVLVAYSIVVVYPLVWTLFSSLKTNADLFDDIFAPPSHLNFVNYANAWTRANISQYFLNSVTITIASVVLVLCFATMAAYVLARYRFRLNRLVTVLYISGIMIPGIAGIIPLFIQLKALNMIDNRAALVLVNMVNMMPFSVFMLINFIRTIPTEIEEAGIVDGCDRFSLFGRIMLPLSMPGIIPLVIINFINCWSEIYFSLILLISDYKKTLQVGLYNLQKVQYQRADWVTMFAAIVIVMLPSILVYIGFQKKIIEGVSIGAVKG